MHAVPPPPCTWPRRWPGGRRRAELGARDGQQHARGGGRGRQGAAAQLPPGAVALRVRACTRAYAPKNTFSSLSVSPDIYLCLQRNSVGSCFISNLRACICVCVCVPAEPVVPLAVALAPPRLVLALQPAARCRRRDAQGRHGAGESHVVCTCPCALGSRSVSMGVVCVVMCASFCCMQAASEPVLNNLHLQVAYGQWKKVQCTLCMSMCCVSVGGYAVRVLY